MIDFKSAYDDLTAQMEPCENDRDEMIVQAATLSLLAKLLQREMDRDLAALSPHTYVAAMSLDLALQDLQWMRQYGRFAPASQVTERFRSAHRAILRAIVALQAVEAGKKEALSQAG